jgi:hypothetical protein
MEQRYLPALRELGLELLDPWQLTPAAEVAAIQALPAGARAGLGAPGTSRPIGERNAEAIQGCDLVIARLDGQAVARTTRRARS